MDLLNIFTEFFTFDDSSLIVNLLNCAIGLLIVGGLLFLVLAFMGWLVTQIGFIGAPYQHEVGVVTNKYYKPEATHTGVGAGFSSDGKFTPVVTVTHEDEDFIIEYRSNENQHKYRIETSQEIYDAVDVGDKVKAYYQISRTTGRFRWSGGFERV